jgi:hypothetical protein
MLSILVVVTLVVSGKSIPSAATPGKPETTMKTEETPKVGEALISHQSMSINEWEARVYNAFGKASATGRGLFNLRK